jgi:hypothetical protein
LLSRGGQHLFLLVFEAAWTTAMKQEEQGSKLFRSVQQQDEDTFASW